jgi:phosphatidylinositol-3,4,5-trisphosphate 3-phosphatase and dual-specificity protein phosphatase PTEN
MERHSYLFWENVSKINKKGLVQSRTFVVTADYIYNFKPEQYTKFQRRIDLADVSKLYVALDTRTVLIKVPTEYDYRIMIAEKGVFEQLLKVLKTAFLNKTERILPVEAVADADIKSLVHEQSFMRWEKKTKNQRAPSCLEFSHAFDQQTAVTFDTYLVPEDATVATADHGGAYQFHSEDVPLLARLIGGSKFIVVDPVVGDRERFLRLTPFLDRLVVCSGKQVKAKDAILCSIMGSVVAFEGNKSKRTCFAILAKDGNSVLAEVDALTMQKKALWVKALTRLLQIYALDVDSAAMNLERIYCSCAIAQAPLAHDLLFRAATKREKTRRQSVNYAAALLEESSSDDEEEAASKARCIRAQQQPQQNARDAGDKGKTKKKRLKQSQGEWDQLTNRLMDYLPPRILDLENLEEEELEHDVCRKKSSHNRSAKDLTRLVNIANPDLVRTSHFDSEGILIPKVFSGKDITDALMRGQEANALPEAMRLADRLVQEGFLELTQLKESAEQDDGRSSGFYLDGMYQYAMGNENLAFLIDCRLQQTKGQRAAGITDAVRHLVSLEKVRFVRDGFDLDLTYITRKMIAMGFPSSNLEGMYRNPMESVKEFFEHYHPNHYKVYNLCSERRYDTANFNDSCAYWPFDDHNPCPLAMIAPFCSSVEEYLNDHELNVVAIHCKAGKGRTGLLFCCYLLHSGAAKDAAEALKLFGERRTHNGHGVTIPSQQRYVGYYDRLVHGMAPKLLTKSEWMLSKVGFGPVLVGGCSPCFTVVVNGTTVFKSADHMKVTTYYDSEGTDATPDEGRRLPVQWKNLEVFSVRFRPEDDIVFKFYHVGMGGTKTKIFHCWQNARFITDGHGSSTIKTISMSKMQLDSAVKDKHHSRFAENFLASFTFRQVPKLRSNGPQDEGDGRRRGTAIEAGGDWFNAWEMAIDREDREINASWAITSREISKAAQGICALSSRLNGYLTAAEQTVGDKDVRSRVDSWTAAHDTRNALQLTRQEHDSRVRDLKSHLDLCNSGLTDLTCMKTRLEAMLDIVQQDLEDMPEDEILL